MLVADPAMPGGERVKLLDFGIAKVTSGDGGKPGEPRTRTGLLMGTPIYMSPEQCRGAGLVNDKSDVYSLAVIMYQMLAGRPPFIGEGDGLLIAAHMMDTPPPLAETAPQTTPAIAELVHRMLAKDKAARPSMEEVAAQLEVYERGEPQVVRSLTPPMGTYVSAATTIIPGLVNNPTTLRQSASQKELPIIERRSRLRRLVGAGVVALVAGGIVVALQLGKSTPPPEPSKPADPTPTTKATRPAAAPTKIHWAVTSTPPGAEVLDSATQRVLGKTPWQLERDSGEGTSELLLRAPGFREQRLSVHNDQSGVWQLMLAREPARGGARPVITASTPGKPTAAPKVNPCPADPMCRGRAERGMLLYTDGRYQDALREFQAAYALAQSAPRLLIHIGLCMTQLGLPQKALTYYRSFEKEQPSPDAATKKLLRQYIAEASAASAK